ncbi:hypothetical protein WDU94_015523 [Cyamophila willieti]
MSSLYASESKLSSIGNPNILPASPRMPGSDVSDQLVILMGIFFIHTTFTCAQDKSACIPSLCFVLATSTLLVNKIEAKTLGSSTKTLFKVFILYIMSHFLYGKLVCFMSEMFPNGHGGGGLSEDINLDQRHFKAIVVVEQTDLHGSFYKEVEYLMFCYSSNSLI